MGSQDMARLVLCSVVLLGALCLTAHGATEEVETLESSLRGLETSQDDEVTESLMRRAELALQEHGDVLMQLGERAPPGGVLHLTKKIKTLQTDIKSIRAKKAAHSGKSANAKDLEKKLHQKNHELASLTIKQHEAAANANADAGTGSEGDYDASADDTAGADSKGLFSGWLSSKWSPMHQALNTAISALTSQTAKLKGQADKHDQEVKAHIERVKKAYNKEYRGRLAALKKAKEFQEKKKMAEAAERKAKAREAATKKQMREKLAKALERKNKAVEKKQKQVKTEERLKKKFERQVKALLARPKPKCENCGPIKEKELKAKAEIRRLQALNKKIKADCERKAKEMAQKLKTANERKAKETARANKLARELAAARKTITSLKAQLAAAQRKIKSLEKALALQKQETAKQIRLKKSWMAKYRAADERRKKAEAKVVKLTRQLKIVTAKYTKLKNPMKHINTVSVTPDKKSHVEH